MEQLERNGDCPEGVRLVPVLPGCAPSCWALVHPRPVPVCPKRKVGGLRPFPWLPRPLPVALHPEHAEQLGAPTPSCEKGPSMDLKAERFPSL